MTTLDSGRCEVGSLAGRVVVVTGATGGLGTAICHCVAAAGASVVAGFRSNNAAARALVNALPGNGHSAMPVDVSSAESLLGFSAAIGSRYGTLDVLVNNAGTTRFVPHGDLDALDDALIDEIFATNWRGAFAAIRVLRPLLESGAGGLVVNISSIAAVSGIGSNVAYCASKAAMNAMTVSLARALAPTIRVVAVSPGLVDTDFVKGLDPAWRQDQIRKTALGRLASAEDVGHAVLAAATLLTYSTGSIIPVDGGRLLG